jgi:uncharacterized repeat protein (TIGR03803 family)
MASRRSGELFRRAISALIAGGVVLAFAGGVRAQITYEILHAFPLEGATPTSPVIQATDGNFYGTTHLGGAQEVGTVYKITTTGELTTLHSFDCATDGCAPEAGLVQAADGNFYGTTPSGGAEGRGTVFKITPAGVFTTLHSFACATEGCDSSAPLIQATDGNLYGTTLDGGAGNGGTVFKITTAGVFTRLHAFDCATDGCVSDAGLIQATDGNLYGTTSIGGAGDAGTVFKITTAGAFSTLHAFDCDTEGCGPVASLIQATDGNLYGTTEVVGPGNGGTLFKITTAGTFSMLHAFDCATEGCMPVAGLIQAPDGTFYGTTSFGGVTGGGTVFSFTSAGVFATLHSFDCDVDGCVPAASLLRATDGTLYGTTSAGGVNAAGTLFAITPAGALTTLHVFGCGPEGCNPRAGLVLATNGNFYGTTGGGFSFGQGTVFTITPAGVFSTLNTFYCGEAGACLQDLVQATDGDFYGTSQTGGAHDQGTVFKITAAGVITVLHSFDCTTEGCIPKGVLVQATDGNFYGTTQIGGTTNQGTVFKMTPAGVLTTLHSFDCSTEGCNPFAGLIQATDGNFYGTAFSGGSVGGGTVFRITPAGAVTTLHSFTCGADRCRPVASLVQGADGNLYGTTTSSGGTVFTITTAGALTTLHPFDCATDGCSPQASLIQGADGNFYGTTVSGGTNAGGTVFRITPAGIATVLHAFDCPSGTFSPDGCGPTSNLAVGSDGKFYGTAGFRGPGGGGVVFRLDVGTGPILNALNPAAIWIGLKNSDAVGLKIDLLAELFVDTTKIGEGRADGVSTGSNGFNNAVLTSIPLTLSDGPASIPIGSTLRIKVSARRTCEAGTSHNSGAVVLWYNGKPVDTGTGRDAASRFGATLDGIDVTYFLRAALALNPTPGAARKSIAITVDSKASCPDRAFKPFGTWSLAP